MPMSNLLNHTKLPLWVWIVIITVGSVFILTCLLIIWRCWYIRSAVRDGFQRENSQTPTRRVTVRRGRVVPTSHYLSLTGSKFGLGQFNNLEENREDVKGRSRSPFEWWATLKDRSHSRQSEMTMATASRFRHQVYTPDVEAGLSQPIEETRSPSASLMMTRHQAKAELVPTSNLSIPSPTAQRPSRHTNFSRSFTARQQARVASPSALRQSHFDTKAHSQPGLETSSIISEKSSSFVSATELPNDEPSVPVPLPALQSPPSRHHFPEPPSTGTAGLTSPLPTSTLRTSQPDLPFQTSKPHSESALRSEFYRTSQISRYRSSGSIREQDDPESVTRRSSHTSRPRHSQSFDTEHGTSQYWNSRPDLRPVRKPSKKGNVLRKKSLRRAEIASWVGS